MYSDNAIQLKKDDKLGRYKFAEQIANGLVQASSKSSEGMVIGVTGSWGVGKSSLVNFVVTEIERLHKENKELYEPKILRFNPWMFTGQEELQIIFLSELLKLFRQFDSKIKGASDKLQKFIGKLHFVKYFNAGIHQALEDFSEGLNSLKDEPSLLQLKKEIDQILIETETKLYITIDDIDRLTPSEVCEIFQLVKLNGNFANTTFIMSYDDRVVQGALETVFGEFGRNYVEKIVQVDYSIPELSQERKASVLKIRLKNVLSKKAISHNKEMLEKITEQPYFKLIQSIRDINRLLNSVKLRLPSVDQEIHIPDFILIEALRCFCPKGYVFLYSSKKKFFQFASNKSKTGVEFSEKKKELIKFIESADVEDDAKTIFIDLFVPDGTHQLQADFSKEKHIALNRVTQEYYFNRYFSLELGENEISELLFSKFKEFKRIGRHRVFKKVIAQEQLNRFCVWLPIKLKCSQSDLRVLFYDTLSYLKNVEYHERRIFALNHDFWFLLVSASNWLKKIDIETKRREIILAFLCDKRNQNKFYSLALSKEIIVANERFSRMELNGKDSWYELFSQDRSKNQDFINSIEDNLKKVLQYNLKSLERDFESYNSDEVYLIFDHSNKFIPTVYEKSLNKIIENLNFLLDIIGICISLKYTTSLVHTGYCLEKNGLFEKMDVSDVHSRIKTAENLDKLSANRAQIARFYLHVYKNKFPKDTYYEFNTLKVVSKP